MLEIVGESQSCAIMGSLIGGLERTRVVAVRGGLQRPQGAAAGPTADLDFPACAGVLFPSSNISEK
jgi:hypothetical protein